MTRITWPTQIAIHRRISEFQQIRFYAKSDMYEQKIAPSTSAQESNDPSNDTFDRLFETFTKTLIFELRRPCRRFPDKQTGIDTFAEAFERPSIERTHGLNEKQFINHVCTCRA